MRLSPILDPEHVKASLPMAIVNEKSPLSSMFVLTEFEVESGKFFPELSVQES
jgi:hypothetical protein